MTSLEGYVDSRYNAHAHDRFKEVNIPVARVLDSKVEFSNITDVNIRFSCIDEHARGGGQSVAKHASESRDESFFAPPSRWTIPSTTCGMLAAGGIALLGRSRVGGTQPGSCPAYTSAPDCTVP